MIELFIEKNELLTEAIQNELMSFFIRPIFLFIGLISFFIFALRFRQKDYPFFYFGLFIIIAAIPELDNTIYLLLFNLSPTHTLLYLILPPYFMLLFFTLFIKSIFGAGWKGIVNYVLQVIIAGLVITILLHVTPIAVNSQFLIYAFLVITIVSGGCIVSVILKSGFYKSLRKHLIFRFSIFFFIGTSIASLFFKNESISESLFLLAVLFLSFGMMNILVVRIIDTIEKAANYKIELERNKTELLETKQASIQAQFESLKGQLNPHFLFNSLNALSSLCYPDPKPERAKKFIDEFSKIFRYILEIKDKAVVELKSELDFLNAYYYLQKIRFEEDLQLSICIDEDIYNMLLPPLSLQLLVENAIKHNQIGTDAPLEITIENIKDILIVKNNLQRKKKSDITSTKTGQTNLVKRYQLITEQVTVFYEKDGFYIAKIPLLQDDESDNA
jgi:sensor histidine kinase YesM